MRERSPEPSTSERSGHDVAAGTGRSVSRETTYGRNENGWMGCAATRTTTSVHKGFAYSALKDGACAKDRRVNHVEAVNSLTDLDDTAAHLSGARKFWPRSRSGPTTITIVSICRKPNFASTYPQNLLARLWISCLPTCQAIDLEKIFRIQHLKSRVVC